MLIYILFNMLLIIPMWKVHAKAGQNPAFSMMILFPFVGLLISLSILAFGKWDIEKAQQIVERI